MTNPMAMLPNDKHPGPGCSCRDCLRTYAEARVETQAPQPSGIESYEVGEVRREWPHNQRLVLLEDYEALNVCLEECGQHLREAKAEIARLSGKVVCEHGSSVKASAPTPEPRCTISGSTRCSVYPICHCGQPEDFPLKTSSPHDDLGVEQS